MVIKLSPPTQNEVDLYEGSKTEQLFPTDLNQEVDKQGTTPKMGSFVAEAEKLGVSRKETTRADAGLAGDFVKGFNEIILALPDAAINAIDTCFKEFVPRNKFQIIDTVEKPIKYEEGILI